MHITVLPLNQRMEPLSLLWLMVMKSLSLNGMVFQRLLPVAPLVLAQATSCAQKEFKAPFAILITLQAWDGIAFQNAETMLAQNATSLLPLR